MSLAESLEKAAVELPEDADGIRPANGDPIQLFDLLSGGARRRVLCWLLANASEDAQELALCWIEETEGASDVAAVETENLSKEGKKVLRRVLHRARSQGLVKEGAQDAVPHVARLAQVDEKISAGFLAPHDPRGGRLVYLVESSPGGGARVFEALLDEDRGVVDFQVYRAGRRQVKSFIRDVTQRERFAAVETDAQSVRALIARRARAQPESQPLPAAFKEWRNRMAPDGEILPTPGDGVLASLSSEADEEQIRALVGEVEAGRLGPWPPQPAVLETAMQPVRASFSGEAAGPDTELDKEALAEAVHVAVHELYASDLRPVNAERLEESAYLFWKQDEAARAQACLASAGALREEGTDLGPVMAACAKIVGDALVADLQRSLGDETGVQMEKESPISGK